VTADDEQAARRETSMEERSRHADLWEASADERERLADERERLADEREALANERDRLADDQERRQEQRDTAEPLHPWAAGDRDAAAEEAATRAAVRRAEAAVLRAEAELERARQAATRVRARSARRAAAGERHAATRQSAKIADTAERAWLVDRRDFVAAERDHTAEERDMLANRRDDVAGLRERQADQRERELLASEEHVDRTRPARSDLREPMMDRAAYADGARQRERAAVGRQAAAQDRAGAAARWGPQAYGPMLLASFAELARHLFGNEDLREALAQVVKFTVGAVAGCDCASVTLYRHGRVVDTVASGAAAAELDDVQFASEIGPGPEAMQSENPVYVPGLAESRRWPVLAATAGQLGVASAVCYGLFLHRPAHWSALGVFTLYGTAPDAFTDEDQEFASMLAVYVAVAVAMAQRRDEVDRREAALHRALSTRDVIGQAKGILMERQKLSAGEAFDLLRRVSQRLNRKLAEVAQEVAETGAIPG
jgi:hypothetical protein